VNIANGSYQTPGILTAKNNKGIGGKELISVKTTEYKNIANEIPYYSDKPYENENENKSHDFWKMSMEGYSLSGVWTVIRNINIENMLPKSEGI